MNDQRVPREFVGKARTLRARIAATHSDAEVAQARLLDPIRPKPRFAPYPTHGFLRRLARRWLHEMPAFGQIVTTAEMAAGELALAEVRCAPGMMKFLGWDTPELAIILYRFVAVFAAPQLVERRTHLCSLGLHCLARYYQRADDATSQGLFRAMAALVPAYTKVSRDPEFVVEAGGGAWRGMSTLIASHKDAAPVLAIRTFTEGR